MEEESTMANKNLSIRNVAALTGIAALALAGCSHDDSADNPPPVTNTTVVVVSPAPGAATGGTAAVNGVPARADNTNAGAGGATGTQPILADQINTQIVRNTQMTGSRVTAVVDTSGIATLNGFVQNQQQKALAEKAAHDTAGVSSVKNKIEIRPTGGVGQTAPQPGGGAAPKVTVINNYIVGSPHPSAPASAAADGASPTDPNADGGAAATPDASTNGGAANGGGTGQ